MRQGTTPIVTLNVAEDFDNCNVYVTIDQNGFQITKASRESPDIEITKHYADDGTFDYSKVAMYLTQAETLGLDIGKARVQIRWVDFIGNAFATDIKSFDISESLLTEVIEYGN